MALPRAGAGRGLRNAGRLPAERDGVRRKESPSFPFGGRGGGSPQVRWSGPYWYYDTCLCVPWGSAPMRSTRLGARNPPTRTGVCSTKKYPATWWRAPAVRRVIGTGPRLGRESRPRSRHRVNPQTRGCDLRRTWREEAGRSSVPRCASAVLQEPWRSPLGAGGEAVRQVSLGRRPVPDESILLRKVTGVRNGCR